MGKDRAVTQEQFDALLLWLDADREQAALKYENIRKRLIRYFICRGCFEPEELADKTFDRVCEKVPELSRSYVGDPALFIFGVAQNIYLEYLREVRARHEHLRTHQEVAPETDEEPYNCLDSCIQTLTPENRELALRYYQDDKRLKIDHRQELAVEKGIAINALRIRAHRIRRALKKCVESCLEQAA